MLKCVHTVGYGDRGADAMALPRELQKILREDADVCWRGEQGARHVMQSRDCIA